jgi:hypothetical protein
MSTPAAITATARTAAPAPMPAFAPADKPPFFVFSKELDDDDEEDELPLPPPELPPELPELEPATSRSVLVAVAAVPVAVVPEVGVSVTNGSYDD